MRGGTSRGPFFLAADLPADPVRRDAVLVGAMGAGHALQIDGLGGGNALTSKVAIVGPATVPGADVDYLFAQVKVLEREVDTSPNCGNMLAAVGPFAIEQGLVPARPDTTQIRIHNVNTGKIIEARVATPGGHVTYDGAALIDGVPGTAAPVYLAFVDAAGSRTCGLFPTGATREIIEGVTVTCVDAAMPLVVIEARSLGKTGAETPDELWLCAHPPVFTLGLAGKPEHLLRDIGIPLVKIDRGGQITYHGPGQIVCYLLLDLKRRGLTVKGLINRMEQAVIDLLAEYGIAAERLAGAPGDARSATSATACRCRLTRLNPQSSPPPSRR